LLLNLLFIPAIASALAHSISIFLFCSFKSAFCCAVLTKELIWFCCFNIDSLFAEPLPPPLNELSLCVVSITCCPCSLILVVSLSKSALNISSAVFSASVVCHCICSVAVAALSLSACICVSPPKNAQDWISSVSFLNCLFLSSKDIH